ncbi:hypothetical protein BaRGS_00029832 [Batillaria attramentaria]|uniref:Uncharacterized protein n=1 Tax=Batillaria attramentaria TaxID=370345 RepID=A0ABD0JWD4_9CAEN
MNRSVRRGVYGTDGTSKAHTDYHATITPTAQMVCSCTKASALIRDEATKIQPPSPHVAFYTVDEIQHRTAAQLVNRIPPPALRTCRRKLIGREKSIKRTHGGEFIRPERM